MKRVILILLGLFSLFLPVHAQEELPPYARVCVDEQFLRLTPATNVAITLMNGQTRLEVLEETRNAAGEPWTRVKIIETEQEGWAFTPYLCYYYPGATIAEVKATTLNVRSAPDGEIIGQLDKGTQVELIALGDGWWHIRGDGLEGWADADYLHVIKHGENEVPHLITDRLTPPVPIPAQGVITAHFPDQRSNVSSVHTLPSIHAPLIGNLQEETILAVYGYDASYDWSYIHEIGGSLQGWVLSLPLTFPQNFDLSTLPVLDAVESPALPVAQLIQPIENYTGLVGGLDQEIYWEDWKVPAYSCPCGNIYTQANVLKWVPYNAALLITGRNANSTFFRTEYAGDVIWLHYDDVRLPDDPNRLPIITLIGSPTLWDN